MLRSHSSYKIEMFSTASVPFRKEFLKNTKNLLAHGLTIQRHLSKLNHANTRNIVDCIWETSQTLGKKVQWWPCEETSRNCRQTRMFITSIQTHFTRYHRISGWKPLWKVYDDWTQCHFEGLSGRDQCAMWLREKFSNPQRRRRWTGIVRQWKISKYLK